MIWLVYFLEAPERSRAGAERSSGASKNTPAGLEKVQGLGFIASEG